jgi:hypothetical protein
MPTTNLDVAATVDEMIAWLETAEQKEYGSISARGLLVKMGLDDDDVESVIQALANAGWTYCLDPAVKNKSHTVEEYGLPSHPPAFACVWGYDQLRSRLWSYRHSL